MGAQARGVTIEAAAPRWCSTSCASHGGHGQVTARAGGPPGLLPAGGLLPACRFLLLFGAGETAVARQVVVGTVAVAVAVACAIDGAAALACAVDRAVA